MTALDELQTIHAKITELYEHLESLKFRTKYSLYAHEALLSLRTTKGCLWALQNEMKKDTMGAE